MCRIIARIYSFFFPYICCICDDYSDRGNDLCSYCLTLLPTLQDVCYRCGLSLQKEMEHIICNSCAINPPAFDRLCTIYQYKTWPRKLIQELKYRKKLFYSKVIADILMDATFDWYQGKPLPEAIIPIPLHINKLQARGFNQTYELIKPISKKLKIPALLDLCIKHKSTTPQAELSLEQRKKNVKNTFRLNNLAIDAFLSCNYKHIAIFDDVVTTMSTVKEVSLLLRSIGVETIDIWCICRA